MARTSSKRKSPSSSKSSPKRKKAHKSENDCGENERFVQGYTKSDGTYVEAYCRKQRQKLKPEDRPYPGGPKYAEHGGRVFKAAAQDSVKIKPYWKLVREVDQEDCDGVYVKGSWRTDKNGDRKYIAAHCRDKPVRRKSPKKKSPKKKSSRKSSRKSKSKSPKRSPKKSPKKSPKRSPKVTEEAPEDENDCPRGTVFVSPHTREDGADVDAYCRKKPAAKKSKRSPRKSPKKSPSPKAKSPSPKRKSPSPKRKSRKAVSPKTKGRRSRKML